MRLSSRMLWFGLLFPGLSLAASNASEPLSSAPATVRGAVSGTGELSAIRFSESTRPFEVQFEWTGGERKEGVRLSKPDRFFIDLEGTRISPHLVDREFLVGNGIASRVRLGQNGPNMTRVVFDLEDGNARFQIEDTTQPPGFLVSVVTSDQSVRIRDKRPVAVVADPESRTGGTEASAEAEVFSAGELKEGELSEIQVRSDDAPLDVLFVWTGKSRREAVRLSQPERLYIDLEGTRLSTAFRDEEVLVENGIASRVRVGQNSVDTARVVFDLKATGDLDYTVEDTIHPPGFRVRFFRNGQDRMTAQAASSDRSARAVRMRESSPPVLKTDSSQVDRSVASSGASTHLAAPSIDASPTVAATEGTVAFVESGETGINAEPSQSEEEVLAMADAERISGSASSGEPGIPARPLRRAASSPGNTALSEGITLDEISGLEMQFGDLEFSSSQRTAESVTEVVNPFKVRKRGRFYGSIYEYLRNDNFDARNFFDPVGEPLPEFKRNQFGVSFGAFLSSRLSVFGTYDGLRIVRGSTLLSHIATPEMKQGDFSSLTTQLVNPFTDEPFENNQIPQDLFNPVAVKMMSTIPDPNRTDPERNFVNNLPEIENVDDLSGRVDYDLSADTKIFGRYSFNESASVNIGSLPAFGTNEDSRRQSFSLDLNRNLGPSLVTSVQLNLNRTRHVELSKNVAQGGILDSLGIEGLSKEDDLDEGYPYFRLEGYATMGLSRRNPSPRTLYSNSGEVQGAVTWVPSNHKISFGGEVGLIQMNNVRTGGHRRGSFRFSGNYTGDAFADFLLGVPDVATRGLGTDRGDYRRRSWRLSARDEWKVSSKLNLSFLLSYYRYSPYWSSADNVSIFWPLLFEPPSEGALVVMGSEEAALAGLPGLRPGQAMYVDQNDWAPGIGVAYSPLGNNRVVLRASYGINYLPVDYREAESYLGRNYPFFYFEEADAPSNSPDLDLSHPFNAITNSETTVRGFDPFIRTAYTQHWQLELQNEFARNWSFEIGYHGRKSTHLTVEQPANIPLPGKGSIQRRRPNPTYGRFDILSGSGSSVGHALQLQMDKRLSRGFSVRAGFNWDRTFTDVYYRDPSNPRDLSAERAPASMSPKRFFLNYIYDLPFGPGRAFSTAWAGKLGFIFSGWRVSGITNLTGGRPFNPLVKGDFNNDGATGDRPDRIGSGRLNPDEQSIDQWFATSDFVKPAPFTFGNSGRNILLTPAERVWDISLIKSTDLSREGSALEFRIQLFNAFNHVNFDEPEETLGVTGFGQIFGADEAREIEFALKYSF